MPIPVFESVVDALSGSSWSYAIVFAIATLDAFFPIVPSEATAITAGVLEERGSYIITVARFIPGGRTATTFTAGYVRFPWRKFLLFDLIAASIWGSYTVLLGYFGGATFEEQPWKGLLLAFAIALAVTALIEAVRYLRHRRQAA